MTHKARIEAAYGAPVTEVIWQFAQAGYEQQHAAQILGVTPSRIRVWRAKAGFRWPTPQSRLANITRHSKDRATRTEWRGERLTLTEIAERSGIPRQRIRQRYSRGDRGERLTRPPQRYTMPKPVYEVGYTYADWQAVLEYSRGRTVNAVALCFDLPIGAIKAAQAGQWERLA